MQTVDSVTKSRKDEAMKVIEIYEALAADPLRMAKISSPLESAKLFRIRARTLRKQYGIKKQR